MHCFKAYLCENLDAFINYVHTASENYFQTESFSFSQLSADSDGFLNRLKRTVNFSGSFIVSGFDGNIQTGAEAWDNQLEKIKIIIVVSSTLYLDMLIHF